MLVSEIDFSRVPQRAIRKFLKTSKLKTLEELIPVCYSPTEEPYFYHCKEYTFPFNINNVWEKYIFLHPTACWDSAMISLGIVYSRPDDQVLYRDSDFDQLQKGQLYFIRLNILGSLLQIPVIHEINEVDHENKVIKSCYVDKGKSQGSQWIKLVEVDEHTTRIVHETRYKGDSKIRDKYLYPIFHTKALDQFHGNVLRELNQEASIFSTSS
ncbi:hypothetical protein [Marinoscillum sp. MHG1-6]|uniref:hypothetical protein n=1 Tax=Marinoscillum sp. MHG1-6 TaxID=2959627 RepID=UPI0021586DEE|nr:hypothetical protein [Marinoscillum sp. MHG1-6]